MNGLIGVTHGRLIQPPAGVLQYFPQQEWKDEMRVAHRLGINYVEWLIERQYNPSNPIWSEEGTDLIVREARLAGLTMYSTVNDYIIDHSLADVSGDAHKQMLELIVQAQRLSLRVIVVPLFEASAATAENFEIFVPYLRESAAAAREHKIELVLETLLPVAPLRELIKAIDQPNVSACFDAGNRAAAGQDIYADVRELGSLIRHVHIKDKSDSGENVFLGTGMVDFRRFFESLADIGYRGNFTLETPRGTDPVTTAAYHLALIRFFAVEAGLPISGGERRASPAMPEAEQ